MSRKKTTKSKTTRRRRRRVGAINTSEIMSMVLGSVAGAAIGGIICKTVMQGKNPMMQGLVLTAGGVALSAMMPSGLGKFAGVGLIAVGGTKFLAKFNIAGVGDDESFTVPLAINGSDGLTMIAGPDDYTMAGDEYDTDGEPVSGSDGLTVLAGLGSGNYNNDDNYNN